MLKIGQNLWVHEALIHEVVLPFVRIPMQHRMTVIRLADGQTVLHSPTMLTAKVRDTINEIGPVAAVVAPSWWHDLHLEDTLALYSRARLYVAPTLLASHQHLQAHTLGGAPPELWFGQIEQTQIAGIGLHFDEYVFYHRASRTLVLADLFASDDAFVGWQRRVARSVSGPGCGFPRLFRAAVVNRERFKASIDRVLEWDFDRIVIGHGTIVETDGRQAFRNAFQWLS